MRLPTLPSSLLELSVSPRSDPPGAPAALQTLRREVISSLRRSAEARGRPKRQLFAVDEDLSASFLADLQLETCAPLRDALAEADAHPALAGVRGGSDRGGSAPATDLRAFVVEVSDGVRANPLLVELLVQLLRRAERSNRSLLSANDDSEIYRLVHYSITLDRITRTLAADAEVAAAVFSTLKCAVRADGRWWRHLSPFEHAKLLTVELTLQNFVAARREERIAPSFGHIGLPFNILEAVLEDLRFGHGDNAAAGLALMRARPGQSEPGQAEASLSDDGRRAVRIHLPQAERWKHLYVSWNMAFTSIYGDSPYFAAALLAPSVLGASPSEFIYHRVFALHLHMAGTIQRRMELGVCTSTERVHSRRDWRHPEVTEVWGRLNREGARRYQMRRALAMRHAGPIAGGFHSTNYAFHLANGRAVLASRRLARSWRGWAIERQRAVFEKQWSNEEAS